MKGEIELPSRFPEWMRRKLLTGGKLYTTEEILNEAGLNTVCQSAKCPNRGECYGKGTATFMIMGEVCTRGCHFCAVEGGNPQKLNLEEPEKLALAAKKMKLQHIVITSVTRDDLPDGGAGHFAETLKAIHRYLPDATVEVLTPDFQGDLEAVETVLKESPDIYNHNLETIPRLYSSVRPGANYLRSLNLLRHIKDVNNEVYTKSGIMVGLGETYDEVIELLGDLRSVGCDILTVGQYLRPSANHIPVVKYITPEEFSAYEKAATKLGFLYVSSGPYVRSSYLAHDFFNRKKKAVNEK